MIAYQPPATETRVEKTETVPSTNRTPSIPGAGHCWHACPMSEAVTTALAEFLQTLPGTGTRLMIAFSGGLDSSVLLHACARLREQADPASAFELLAVHVDHRLHPESAHWARHCQMVADRLRVPITVLAVRVDTLAKDGPEAAARKARYEAIGTLLGVGDWLLTAHHADDQAETFLLRALRGAGVSGLAAMRPQRALGRATLARPLLAVARSEIRAYAEQHRLHWIEDPSNADPSLDRNFLRQQVLPLLASRWPQLSRSFAASALHLRATGYFAELELDRLVAGALASANGGFALDALAAVPVPARPALLLHWLAGTGLPLPPPKALSEILRQLDHAAADRTLQIRWGNTEVRRYRGSLYAMQRLAPPAAVDCCWNTAERLRLADGRSLWISGQAPPRSFWLRSSAGHLRLSINKGRPERQPRQLFQEHGIPPWQRQRALYLYDDPEASLLPQRAAGSIAQAPEFDAANPGLINPGSRLLAILPWFRHPELQRWLQAHHADICCELAPATGEC